LANIINGTDTGSGGLITTGDSSDELQIQTAETTALTIDSSQNVGIGTSSPSGRDPSNLVLQISSANEPEIKLTAAGGTNTFLTFSPGANTNSWITNTQATNSAMIFGVGGYTTERMRITSAGAVEIANGNLKFTTNGTGIDFSASAGGGASSSLLDDYEEGTWTPIIQGSTTVGTGTYTTQQGTYTKIGNTVRFQAEVVWTAHTGTGQLEVGDYPFTSTAETSPISLGFNGGPTFTLGNFIQAYKNPSNTSSGTAQTSDASVFTSVSVSNTGTVRVSGVYKVA
jgi:hypothetical protein